MTDQGPRDEYYEYEPSEAASRHDLPRHTAHKPRRKRRFRNWLVALPSMLLLVAAIGWSLAWFVMAGRFEEGMDAWMAREAETGRAYSCGGREIGGFPFRFELTCLEPSLRIGEGETAITLSAARLLAVAQVYDPDLALAEIDGPGRVEIAAAEQALVADWGFGRASYEEAGGRLAGAGLVFDDVTARLEATGGEANGSAGALPIERFEMHLRRTPTAPPEARDYDLALTAAGIGEGGSRAGLLATAFALPEGWNGMADFARSWREADGRLSLTDISAEHGEVVARGRGALALDARGFPEGTLSLDVAGLEALAGLVPDDALPGDLSAFMAMALPSIGSRSEIEGRPATTLEMELEDGMVRLGPFDLSDLPSLF